METLSQVGIHMLIGLLAIFCLLSARIELGVLFLAIGLLIPLARWVAERTALPFPHRRPENQ